MGKGVSGTITNAGTLTVWTPSSGTSFVVHGWDLRILVTATLGASSTGFAIGLYDASVSDANIVGVVTLLRGASPAGELYTAHVENCFFQSAAADQALILGPHTSLGATDAIRVAGTVWGTEV